MSIRTVIVRQWNEDLYQYTHTFCHTSLKTIFMKKTTLILVLLYAAFSSAAAQVPKFRETGYKGNVSYTNQTIAWQGIDTSHGYMFNEHHYLGVGAGFFLLPAFTVPSFTNVFIDYHAYIKDKKSTPVLGIKLGFMHAIKLNSDKSGGFLFRNALQIEPGFMWSWGLKSGNGLVLGIHPDICIFKKEENINAGIMPKLSFGFEF